MNITVLSETGSLVLPAQTGQTLLDVLREYENLPIQAPCGGQGTCRKCTVYLTGPEGETPVLACRTRAEDGMVPRLPLDEPVAVELHGSTRAVFWPDPGLCGYGIACDIGTTTVVCELVDLSTGRILNTVGEGNAQRPYGADVIARIKASMDGMQSSLTAAIIGQLSRMIGMLCHTAEIPIEQVGRMAVAANTTMCHLLAGLSPDGIGVAPFVPASLFGDCRNARGLGLPFDGEVYICPAVSGYVGGDITADLLAVGMDRMESPALLIDVGTNGEMALGCKDKFVCCSTAAGPAFEGAQIRYGMTAAPGAVSAVQLVDGKVVCSVIGEKEPIGLCGSGLIDAIAVMLDMGAVDETGRMLDIEEDIIPEELVPYLFLLDGIPAFRLTGEVAVTQEDVRKLQLGKGAIAAGIRVMLDSYGADFGQVDALLLAGGFGSYIRPESAARIGLIPAELLSVTRAVGNAAAQGALDALVSSDARERLARLQKTMDYRELSGLSQFNDAYMDAMMFPEEV